MAHAEILHLATVDHLAFQVEPMVFHKPNGEQDLYFPVKNVMLATRCSPDKMQHFCFFQFRSLIWCQFLLDIIIYNLVNSHMDIENDRFSSMTFLNMVIFKFSM